MARKPLRAARHRFGQRVRLRIMLPQPPQGVAEIFDVRTRFGIELIRLKPLVELGELSRALCTVFFSNAASYALSSASSSGVATSPLPSI